MNTFNLKNPRPWEELPVLVRMSRKESWRNLIASYAITCGVWIWLPGLTGVLAAGSFALVAIAIIHWRARQQLYRHLETRARAMDLRQPQPATVGITYGGQFLGRDRGVVGSVGSDRVYVGTRTHFKLPGKPTVLPRNRERYSLREEDDDLVVTLHLEKPRFSQPPEAAMAITSSPLGRLLPLPPNATLEFRDLDSVTVSTMVWAGIVSVLLASPRTEGSMMISFIPFGTLAIFFVFQLLQAFRLGRFSRARAKRLTAKTLDFNVRSSQTVGLPTIHETRLQVEKPALVQQPGEAACCTIDDERSAERPTSIRVTRELS